MDDTDVKLNDQRRRKKRENEGINNRQKTLLHKAHELGGFEGVEVAVIIRKHGKYTTYVSEGYRSQQPSFREIQTAYPLPKNFLPEDIEKRRFQRTRRKLSKENQEGSWTTCELVADQEVSKNGNQPMVDMFEIQAGSAKKWSIDRASKRRRLYRRTRVQ
ncbi:hypothetical protein BKA64DRAFT_647976 [Cadophora sp. MPI-SDFR-AT-0126]|nr:hypothetical protein BKA64DRAFT_647976 [Leotiomycetes sp. MPI-SDFR-AT-0126]